MDTGRAAARRTEDDLGVTHTWGDGPEVVFLSNPLAAPDTVRAAVLLAPYGRQNQIDVVLQQAWDDLLDHGTDGLRLLLNLLTAFPPERLADDGFVRQMRAAQHEWAGPPDPRTRRRSAAFIASYQDRLAHLAAVAVPCLVVGFELDTDTFAARAREVADAIPAAEYLELPGLGHAAPAAEPHQVWPPALGFLARHHPAR